MILILYLLIALEFCSAQTLKGVQVKLLALQSKADKKFKDYEVAFSLLGKRLFAAEENLSKALETIDKQQEKVDKLIHAQLLCGCANDYNTENFSGKKHHVGVNLLLDLLLKDENFSEAPKTTKRTTQETTKRPTTTKKTTTTTRTPVTIKTTTKITKPPQDLGGFDIAQEATTSAPDYDYDFTTASDSEPDEAKCVEKANINAFIMSTWKNTQENVFQFNGDVVAKLPAELPAFSILLIKFDPPLLEIETWDQGSEKLFF